MGGIHAPLISMHGAEQSRSRRRRRPAPHGRWAILKYLLEQGTLVAEAGGVAAAVAALEAHPSVTGRESNLGAHSSSADRLIPCPPRALQDVGVQVAALSCLSCLAVSGMPLAVVSEAMVVDGATAAVAALRAHSSEKEVQATKQVLTQLSLHT